jgi:hypothetical protein
MMVARYFVETDGAGGWQVFDRVLGLAVFGCDDRRCAAQFAHEHNAMPINVH